MEVKDRLRYELKYGRVKDWWIDITDIAKKFFGDIVVKVEISNFYDYSEEDVIKATTSLIEKLGEKINNDEGIEFDAENMRVTFVNGKEIEIWNSEWGGIRNVTPIEE